jgi:hypothetical protein
MVNFYSSWQRVDFAAWPIYFVIQVRKYNDINMSSTYEASFTRGPETTLFSTACKWQKEKVVENPPPNTSAAFSPA